MRKIYLLRIVCAILALSMLLCFASCSGDTESTDVETANDNTTVSAGDASEPADDTDITALADVSAPVSESEAASQEDTSEISKLPETPQEILDAYASVMNKAKSEKVGYKKAEWQELPDDAANRNIQKTSGILPMSQIIEAILNLVNKNYMTSESDAKSNVEINARGTDMKWFPVYKTPKGCILTDAGALSSAKSEQLENGNIKLTFKLKSEIDPEPASEGSSVSPSNHGGVLSPLSRKKDIDPELDSNLVKALAKDVNYTLKYFNCEAILVYNPKTLEAVSLKQYTYVEITGTAKVLGCGIDIKQVLKNTLEIWDLTY